MLVILDLYVVTRVDAEEPDPRVAAVLDGLTGHQVKLAICTHQGGPLWRAWKNGDRYPDAPEVASRLLRVAEMYPPLKSALWLVSLHDERVELEDDRQRAVAAALSRAAQPLWVFSSTLAEWHRPNLGMLTAACDKRGTRPQHALFLGRKGDDREAAGRAGVRYLSGSVVREEGGLARILRILGIQSDNASW